MALPLPLSQSESLHLAGLGSGQGVHELDAAGILVRRDAGLDELLQPLQWVAEMRRTMAPPRGRAWSHGRWPSTTTQFVVGGAGESDLELLTISHYLIQKLALGRTYFSAFSPISDTPLENHPAENPLREHRLYQASFLFRDYGFDLEEMPFDEAGNLPLNVDPKLAWTIRSGEFTGYRTTVSPQRASHSSISGICSMDW